MVKLLLSFLAMMFAITTISWDASATEISVANDTKTPALLHVHAHHFDMALKSQVPHPVVASTDMAGIKDAGMPLNLSSPLKHNGGDATGCESARAKLNAAFQLLAMSASTKKLMLK